MSCIDSTACNLINAQTVPNRQLCKSQLTAGTENHPPDDDFPFLTLAELAGSPMSITRNTAAFKSSATPASAATFVEVERDKRPEASCIKIDSPFHSEILLSEKRLESSASSVDTELVPGDRNIDSRKEIAIMPLTAAEDVTTEPTTHLVGEEEPQPDSELSKEGTTHSSDNVPAVISSSQPFVWQSEIAVQRCRFSKTWDSARAILYQDNVLQIMRTHDSKIFSISIDRSTRIYLIGRCRIFTRGRLAIRVKKRFQSIYFAVSDDSLIIHWINAIQDAIEKTSARGLNSE